MNLFAKAASASWMANRLKKKYVVADDRLAVDLFGLRFANPVGLAAGFDKHGEWFQQLGCLGFGCIEIGTVTGQPQPGNPKPRMFRLPHDKALINRMGFNSPGCESVAQSLSEIQLDDTDSVLGINIGKSKVVPLEDAPAEYQQTFEKLFAYGDYFTVNVSSPNTPGLRQLQGKDQLLAILESVAASNQRLSQQLGRLEKPVLLKIAPDLSNQQLDEIVQVARHQKLSGLIATNTTISRDGLKTSAQDIEDAGAGGLSGHPLRNRSRQVVAYLYSQLRGEIPIVGVGGVSSGEDAWQMICAGANLVQLYTGFVYGGPGIVRDINKFLLSRLENSGFENISHAVGQGTEH